MKNAENQVGLKFLILFVRIDTIKRKVILGDRTWSL